MSLYHLIDNLLASGKKTALLTVLSSEKDGGLTGRKLVLSDSGVAYSEFDQSFSEVLKKAVASQFESGTSSILEIYTEVKGSINLFFHIYTIPPRLIIFGGGHVGAALCRIASHLDFEVTVVDDRPLFASQNAHPEADRLICESFVNAFEIIRPLPSDYLVIVTRGHKHDRCCLEQALSVKTAYVGMIGSRRRVKTQLAELAESGFTAEQISHVYSPIGLNIGAVTEAEIAISILAEIIQVRRRGSREENIQVEVLQALKILEIEESPAVLATIVKTLGSTPRKTGSQMIIYPDGSIRGTIGGGCAEADVRREALTCLDRGITEKIRFNLTADAAADEGMACGGTMEIYLELINQPE